MASGYLEEDEAVRERARRLRTAGEAELRDAEAGDRIGRLAASYERQRRRLFDGKGLSFARDRRTDSETGDNDGTFRAFDLDLRQQPRS